jgi:hypothetical protein
MTANAILKDNKNRSQGQNNLKKRLNKEINDTGSGSTVELRDQEKAHL